MKHVTRTLLALVVAALLTPRIAAAQSGAVHVVTYLDIAPAQVAKARPLLQAYRAAVGKAQGSAGVELFQEIGRPGRIVVRETWMDQRAFDVHGKADAATALAAGLKPLALAPPDQRVHLDFASGAGPAKGSQTQAAGRAVHVFSHVDVPPPRQSELEPLLRAVQAESLKAPASVRFDVLQQSSRKNHFTVVEGWADRKALDVQELSTAQRAFRDKLGPMLGALYDQRLYRAMR